MDLMNTGIPLGRWFGIRVTLSTLFLIYAAFRVFRAEDPAGQGLWMAMLFGVVLMHEFGHSLACKAVGGQADHIVLWPLGGLAYCSPPPKPFPQLITTVCGPLVNAVLFPVCLGIASLLPRHTLAWNIAAELAEINLFLLLFNILPVFPMDGGRIVQEVLWFFVGYGRSLMIAGMIGTVGGMGFIVLGLGLVGLEIPIPFTGISYPLGVRGQVNEMLAAIGLMAAISSFGAYRQAQQIESWRKR